MTRLRWTLIVLLGMAATGCAHLQTALVGTLVPRQQPCAAFLNRLDEAILGNGVRDGSTTPVPGFPYLRANRFHVALKERARSPEEREQWIDGMRRLHRESLRKEIENLPAEVYTIPVGSDALPMGKEALLERGDLCSNTLYLADRSFPDYQSLVARAVHVPDEYSAFMRTVGLHPLASLPVIAVTERVRSQFRRTFEKDLSQLPVSGTITAYRPAPAEKRSEGIIRAVIREAADNPLQIPTLTADEERMLALDFAPVIYVDVAGSYDRLGAVVAKDHRFEVDSRQPVAYYYTSHAFKGDRPILQLNYVIWFGERAGAGSPWIERGHLDGLTFRISLSPEGKPFLFDGMNNCGCYHFFVPDRNGVARIKARRFKLDPFVPQWLPAVGEAGRYGVRVSSGWHQVERVLSVEALPAQAQDYELRPYEDLERLEGPLGLQLSLFSERGIARGTGRIEPLIFFPMGVPAVGSMRQRGHHPIDLVGRAHFDDPHLLNRSFVFQGDR